MVLNSIAVFSTGAGVRTLGFVAFVLLVRVLSPSDMGTFALVLAVVEVVRQITELGIGSATVRALARADDEAWPRVGAAGLALRLAGATVGYLILAAATLHPSLESRAPLFLLAGLSLFIGAVANGLITAFQARLGMGRLLPVHLTGASLYLAIVAWGAWHGWGVAEFLGAYVAQEAAAAIGVAVLFARRYRFALAGWLSSAPGLARDAVALGFLGVIVLLYFRLDVFMLEAIRGSDAVGEYAFAFRISEAFLLISAAVSASVFPRFAALVGKDDHALAHFFGRMYCGAVVFGGTLALAVSVAITPVLEVLAPQYTGTGPLAVVLVWAFVFMFANAQTVDLLVAVGRTRAVTWIAVVNLCVNAVGNAILIPRYGALGAAAATVLTEAVNALAQAWFVRARLRIAVPIVAWLWPAALAIGALLYRLEAGGNAVAACAALAGGVALWLRWPRASRKLADGPSPDLL